MSSLFFDIRYQGRYIGTAPDNLKKEYTLFYLASLGIEPDPNATIEYILAKPALKSDHLHAEFCADMA
jgi:hypothetical protein